jgi:hypothetical protein
MTSRRRHLSLAPAALAAVFALSIPAAGTSWLPGGSVRLGVAGGTLEVLVVPDDGSALRLIAEGGNHWRFAGSTADLVGESYSVVLRNRTGERLKVVVGVDGLNVYEREEVIGRADEDVGSILSPWDERTLRGWQIGDHRAQRFVFSPPEWSEGEGRTDSEIGLLTVQVYREWRPREEWDYDSRDQRGALGGAPDPPTAAPRRRAEGAEDSAAAAPKPEARAARPPIGTTAGDDVASNVRTVRFHPASRFPEAWAVIDYGQTRRARHHRDDDRWYDRRDLLGLSLEESRDGARVIAVVPGSPAALAGLEAWDVIVRIDSVHRPSAAATRRILLEKDPGDYAFLRVRRGPHELAVKIRS